MKWEGRERKLHKRRHGMRVSGRSVLLLKELVLRRARNSRESRNSGEKKR